MSISAKEVMALRQKTGAGIMDCKKALMESQGDVDKAISILREKGLARMKKRQDRTAEEGLIVAYCSEDRELGVLLEVNCETDFVARTDDFKDFTGSLLKAIVSVQPSMEEWGDLDLDGIKAREALDKLSAKLGEKMEVRRFQIFRTSEGKIDTYIHGEGKLGVMLEYMVEGDDDKGSEIANNLSMQIAAFNPTAITRNQVPEQQVKEEMEIYKKQALNEGKPEHIVERIAEGKLNKFYGEVCLLEQQYIKETKITVREYLDNQARDGGVKVEPRRFVRFALGGN